MSCAPAPAQLLCLFGVDAFVDVDTVAACFLTALPAARPPLVSDITLLTAWWQTAPRCIRYCIAHFTHTHTHKHTRTHAHTHTPSLSHTHTHSQETFPPKTQFVWFISVLKSGDMEQCPEKSPSPCNTCHTCVIIQIDVLICHKNARKHTHTHIHTYMAIYIISSVFTHTHARTHTHTHTHTHYFQLRKCTFSWLLSLN